MVSGAVQVFVFSQFQSQFDAIYFQLNNGDSWFQVNVLASFGHPRLPASFSFCNLKLHARVFNLQKESSESQPSAATRTEEKT